MPKKIIIVRHGETQDNVERRFQGWIDTPLNAAGLNQARAATKRLQSERISAIYTSDLLRAKKTAEIIATTLVVPLHIRKELRENDMGRFSGWQWEKEKDPYLESLWQELEASRREGNLDWDRHGGESHARHLERTKKFLTEVESKHSNETIAVVTHGGSINRFMEIIHYKAVDEYIGYGNTAITILEKQDNKYVVTVHNDTSHLSVAQEQILQSNDQ